MDCGTKPLPFTKTVTSLEVDAKVVVGVIEVMCGTGLWAGVMMNGNEILVWFGEGKVPPPGCGVVTLKYSVCAVESSAAVRVAVRVLVS